jgi:hypothetical protein
MNRVGGFMWHAIGLSGGPVVNTVMNSKYGKLQMLFEEVLEWQVLKKAMYFRGFINAHLQIAKL